MGKKIKDAMIAHFKKESPNYTNINQLFPSHGDGGLDESSLERVMTKYSLAKKSLDEARSLALIVAIGRRLPETVEQSIKDELPRLRFVQMSDILNNDGIKDYENLPHMKVLVVDNSPLENVSHSVYLAKEGYFFLKGEERSSWIKKHTNTIDKNARVHRLKDIHLKSLLAPTVVPIYSTPYSSIVSGDLTVNQSKVIASDALWKITL